LVPPVSNEKKLDGASARCGIEGFQARPKLVDDVQLQQKLWSEALVRQLRLS